MRKKTKETAGKEAANLNFNAIRSCVSSARTLQVASSVRMDTKTELPRAEFAS